MKADIAPDHAAPRWSGRRWPHALGRSLAVVLFGAVPIAAMAYMLVVAIDTSSIAADFHNEIYPQTEEMLAGSDPYPHPGSSFTAGPNYVWPPIVAVLAAPTTLLPPGAADVLIVLLGVVCFALSLWIVGVRDWRVYGATALWPSVLGDIRVAHLTPVLCMLVAVAWRYRHHRWASGVAIGAAVSLKLWVWPLILWLGSRRNVSGLVTAAAVSGLSLLLLLPYLSIHEYARVLHGLAEAFDQDTYTAFGLLANAGLSDLEARLVNVVLGLAMLALAWQRGSFGLFVGGALVLSPIVWLDYYALIAIPLAVVQPRLGWIWLVPMAAWGLLGAGYGIGATPAILRMLVIFGVLLWFVARAESHQPFGRSAQAGRTSHTT